MHLIVGCFKQMMFTNILIPVPFQASSLKLYYYIKTQDTKNKIKKAQSCSTFPYKTYLIIEHNFFFETFECCNFASRMFFVLKIIEVRVFYLENN